MNASDDRIWFSQYFGLDDPQFKLPFVDFNLNGDVPLYIDPYAITKDPSELAAACHNCLLSYFQTLLAAIRSGNRTQIRRLLSGHLSEPKEIHLGVGKRARIGKGIGKVQESLVIEALANSTAAKSGVIQAIEELELHIDGIGPDKISDLVGNIILCHLSEYTEGMCAEYGIETNHIAVSGFWDPDKLEWNGGYFNLPSRGNDAYMLVPKRFVRHYKDLLNHSEFYTKYILSTLQQELLSADDALVRTLKDGAKRIPTKKSISEDPRFPFSKEFISQYITEHSEVMQAYRKGLMKRFKPVDPAVPSTKATVDDPDVLAIIERLKGIMPGKAGAGDYHSAIYELIQFIFDFALDDFGKEFKMDGGRSRIDIISNNIAGGGLFSEYKSIYRAFSVPMECKNYKTELGNDEFNQIMERLGPKTSQLGMLFCRSITDVPTIIRHLKDRFLRHGCMILLFDDKLVELLAVLRLQRSYTEIESLLRRLARSIEYGSNNYG